MPCIITLVCLIIILQQNQNNTTHSRLVLIRILGFKMLIFGLCSTLYFLKLTVGIGFFIPSLPARVRVIPREEHSFNRILNVAG